MAAFVEAICQRSSRSFLCVLRVAARLDCFVTAFLAKTRCGESPLHTVFLAKAKPEGLPLLTVFLNKARFGEFSFLTAIIAEARSGRGSHLAHPRLRERSDAIQLEHEETGSHDCSLMRSVWLVLLSLSAMHVSAETVIHRCAQEDGTIAFQETPCAEPADNSDSDGQEGSEEPAPTSEFIEFVNPFDQPEEAPAPSEPARPRLSSQDRAACEKAKRDAIDAIDFEMRKGYSKEEGQQYLAELLELTGQLRACKQL